MPIACVAPMFAVGDVHCPFASQPWTKKSRPASAYGATYGVADSHDGQPRRIENGIDTLAARGEYGANLLSTYAALRSTPAASPMNGARSFCVSVRAYPNP